MAAGNYCQRCQRSFVSGAARNQHIRDSPRHTVCHICHQDCDAEAKLNQHLEVDHNCCVNCDQDFDNADDLVQHDIEVHHMCSTCGDYFKSASNRDNVC